MTIMEVDRILYIFGSFTRKKQDKRRSLEQSSISAGNSPLRGARVPRPVSQNLDVPPRTSAYETEKALRAWDCGLCRKELVEPRLLACLHSFCTSCLLSLHQEGESEAWSEIDGGASSAAARPGSGARSAASGYETDQRSEDGWDQKPHKYGIFTRKISGKSVQFLLCPTCKYETPLPLGGIAALPLNYILLRKMVAAGRDDSVGVLCDLCNSDNKAERRCEQCLVSVCAACGDAHARQRATARHSLRPLDPLPVKYCAHHPAAELSVYCSTCQQVICRECCVVGHAEHALGSAARAAADRARHLRDACARARRVPDHVGRARRVVTAQAFEADAAAAVVEGEVRAWAERYARAAAAHGRALAAAAGCARRQHAADAARADQALRERAMHAQDAVRFAEEVLSEARDEEVLSLAGAVQRRLEALADEPVEAPPPARLRFVPLAPAEQGAAAGLTGRLLTRAPDPQRCVLHTDGLQDLRVDCPHDVILELRDSNDERLWCGGEQVAGYFRRQDSREAPAAVGARDAGDGTYALLVLPRAAGRYLLAVTIDNVPIKGSPFPCAVRVVAPHWGRYHCCAYCSSGGRRDAACGCGGAMPGGYRGCGHAAAGWPGRHWSCCGATQRRGACARPATHLYQFSL